jgi:ABC-2 type transport system permease protein
MNPRRSLTITKRVLFELKNDKRTLAMIFIAPIFAMTVFGLAFSGDVHDVKVIVVNEDQGYLAPIGAVNISISQMIIDNIDKSVLDISYSSDVDASIQKVKNGEAYAVIVFSKDLTKNLMMKMQNASFQGNATMKVMADKTNVNVGNAVIKTVSDAVTKTIQQQGFKTPLSIDANDVIYGKGMTFMDFFVPGIMAFVVFLLTTLLTLITFVSEKTSGTLDRMLATPLKESEIVMGYATAFGIMGTLQTCELLAIGKVFFDIPIEGNLVLAFLVIALLAIVSQALGILLSSFAKREAQAIQFFPFIVLPAFLLAGIFWPVEAIPYWLRPLSYLIPPYYAVEGCRAVMLRGWGLDKVWLDIVALLGFAVVFLGLAMVTLRMRRK